MDSTVIMPCTCVHEFQDQMYGKGMRVHNPTGDGNSATCTVCCPSRRRNKTTTRILAQDNRVFGMLMDVPAIGNIIRKPIPSHLKKS